MSFKEFTGSDDSLAVKVKRYNPNSLSNRIGRWFDGLKHPTEKENHFFKAPNMEEHTFGCGWLTAAARTWNDDLQDYNDWFYLAKNKHNLLTNNGRDFFHKQCYSDVGSNASAFAPGSAWIAVSATSFTPATNDTTLNTELTAGTGFARMLGTFAHSAGTNATTITGTFTASGTQNNVQSSGLFTQLAVGGTLTHEANFTSTNFATNDQLQITWTLNLG